MTGLNRYGHPAQQRVAAHTGHRRRRAALLGAGVPVSEHRPRALTQPGDVFYDAEFGWGLYDFIQSEDTELTRLEITQRVRLKLQKREVILPESIEISIAFEDDAVVLHCSFRFAEEDARRELDVIIGAVSVEVVSE